MTDFWCSLSTTIVIKIGLYIVKLVVSLLQLDMNMVYDQSQA